MEADRSTRMTLVQRLQGKDDDKAWDEFVLIYRNYLYVVVRNMNISHHDSEEIVQTVFTKVWDSIKGFQYLPAKGKFRHWLCSIARHTVIDFIRAKKSRVSNADQYPDLEKLPEEISLPDIEAMADKEWVNYIANLALDMIRKDFSGPAVECFLLQVGGKSIPEIAVTMQISENSVYVNCCRVKERIRRKLRQLEQELG